MMPKELLLEQAIRNDVSQALSIRCALAATLPHAPAHARMRHDLPACASARQHTRPHAPRNASTRREP
eukprot:346268-Chlamydomonas_euryale.AAC.1